MNYFPKLLWLHCFDWNEANYVQKIILERMMLITLVTVLVSSAESPVVIVNIEYHKKMVQKRKLIHDKNEASHYCY